MTDNFLLICDGSSGDHPAEVRMASYLTELYNGWKVARKKDKEAWSTTSTEQRTYRWGADGRLTLRQEHSTPP